MSEKNTNKITAIIITLVTIAVTIPLSMTILFNSTSNTTIISTSSTAYPTENMSDGDSCTATSITNPSSMQCVSFMSFVSPMDTHISRIVVSITNNDRITDSSPSSITVHDSTTGDGLCIIFNDSTNQDYDSNVSLNGCFETDNPLTINEGDTVYIELFGGNGGSGSFDGQVTIYYDAITETQQNSFFVPYVAPISLLVLAIIILIMISYIKRGEK